jgi:hypothetical protein
MKSGVPLLLPTNTIDVGWLSETHTAEVSNPVFRISANNIFPIPSFPTHDTNVAFSPNQFTLAQTLAGLPPWKTENVLDSSSPSTYSWEMKSASSSPIANNMMKN